MLNRRLVVLFILFSLCICALIARLSNLQLVEAKGWQDKMRAYVHQTHVIETARGAILDRNGVPLAFDDACYDLAIDYRAMNLDDQWIRDVASKRLAHETFADRDEHDRRLAEAKAVVAAEVDAIPDVVARLCDTSTLSKPSPDAPPKEKILARIQEIRQTIHILREDFWVRHYNKSNDAQDLDEDTASDTRFHAVLRDEVVAHTLVPHISTDQAFYFRQHSDEYPGLVVVNSHVRVYPQGSAACHLIGTLCNVDKNTLQKSSFVLPHLLANGDTNRLDGYLPGDRIGESGLEKMLEWGTLGKLRGTRGVRLVELRGKGALPLVDDGAGDDVSDRRIEPAPGQDVRLTLDIALQKDIEQDLNDPARRLLKGEHDNKNHFAAMVVLSLDGQVLAMVSSPGYDPNTIDATRAQLGSDDYRRPLSNRALQAYQPGSIVKPLVAIGALTENLVTPDTTIVCNGHLFPARPDEFRCSHTAGHGPLQLADAIGQSCNIYFYTLGGRMGIDRLATWFDHFGLGRDSGFELPDEKGALRRSSATMDHDAAFRESLLMGIGQGPISTTPLQMANAYATLLRGGEFVSPRVLLDTPPARVQAATFTAANLAVVRDGMRRAVTGGTAAKAFAHFRLPVAGKTGTAETHRPAFDDAGNPVYDPDRPLKKADGTPKLGPDGMPLFGRASEKGYDAWFVGYAPADNPKFVIAAVMEFGGYGGDAAAPMVREAFLQLEKHNYLPAMDVP